MKLQFCRRECGKIEWICEHGVGHSDDESKDTVHGCDGCCSKPEFKKEIWKQKLKYDMRLCKTVMKRHGYTVVFVKGKLSKKELTTW